MEPDMIVHSNDYNLLKGRITNGHPFLKADALARINALANDLSITQEEASELTNLAKENGVDVMPNDAMGRLNAVEQTTDELTLMVAEMIGGVSV